jgi:hypothetical protein
MRTLQGRCRKFRVDFFLRGSTELSRIPSNLSKLRGEPFFYEKGSITGFLGYSIVLFFPPLSLFPLFLTLLGRGEISSGLSRK